VRRTDRRHCCSRERLRRSRETEKGWMRETDEAERTIGKEMGGKWEGEEC
jgi:hypothetical protein